MAGGPSCLVCAKNQQACRTANSASTANPQEWILDGDCIQIGVCLFLTVDAEHLPQ